MGSVPIVAGTVLAGRFRIEDVLGRGGTAVVYRGRDELLRVDRAIKVLEAGWSPARDQLRKRLRDEARAMARIHHPHVLSVHDVGEVGDVDFVVMDLAEGGSLAQKVDRSGPLSAEEAVRLVGEVLEALVVAHRHGIVHRDVKPQNILLGADGRALLADFGIALLNLDEATRSTRSGVAMGSLAYMAPEQRVDARTVTPAADLYSVGATLYHLLTGANPVDLFMAGPESPRLEAVPPALRGPIVRATRYEPERRYASAEEMGRDLRRATQALVDPRLVGAPAAGSPGRATVRSSMAARVGTLLVVGATVWGVGQGLRTGGRVQEAPPIDPANPAALASAGAEAPEVVDLATSDAGLPATPVVRPIVAPAAARVPEEPPFGRWRGSINGVVTTFDLSGTDAAVRGTVTSTRAGASLSYVVEGRYDRADHTLILADRVDEPGAGEYTLALDPSLRRFSGSFVRKSDGTRVVVQGFR